MVDQDKPFKTIEVIDSSTSQVCKVACMSCIRGHRTTSCGILVCRTKVFWTVKRPGRPSNSCTCRYGATGRCKCVVARAACPHKAKKGEKRSGECRCDEQGRYCCLIEPEHWNLLLSLQKPTVDFFPTREALEARQLSATIAPPTPFSVVSPHPFVDPATPTINGHARHPSRPVPLAARYPPIQSPPRPSSLTPRFGLMGVGGPQGTAEPTHDPMAWQGELPPATSEYYAPPYQPPAQEGSCCQPARPVSQNIVVPPYMTSTFDQRPTQPPPYPEYTPTGHDVSLSAPRTPVPSTFNPNKINIDYFNYQFPNAICQNCGLNGCTCKNCPPVLQNFSNGSWAQCCGRKHARTTVVPEPAVSGPLAPSSIAGSTELAGGMMTSHPYPESLDPFVNNPGLPHDDESNGQPHDYDAFALHQELDSTSRPSPMDMSDYLMSELDRPSTGCGCRDDT